MSKYKIHIKLSEAKHEYRDKTDSKVLLEFSRLTIFNKKITDEDIIYLADYVRTNFTKKTNWKNMKEYLNLPKQ